MDYEEEQMKKGSIIMILGTGEVETRNFLYLLSKYPQLRDFELVFVYQRGYEELHQSLIGEYFDRFREKVCLPTEIRERSRAYNEAVLYAHTDIFIFLEPNMMPVRRCFEFLAESLEQGNILAVQPMVVNYHTGQIQSTGYMESAGGLMHAFKNRNPEEKIVNCSNPRYALSSSLFAINRFVFEELNGFNEKVSPEMMGRNLTSEITLRGYGNFYDHRAKAYYLYDLLEKTEYDTMGNGISDNKLLLPEEGNKTCMVFLLREQVTDCQRRSKYTVMNFSEMKDLENFLGRIGVHYHEIIDYYGFSEATSIEFQKIIPLSYAKERGNYIYVTNNFKQIVDNRMWFHKRKYRKDVVCDLSGNLINIEQLGL